MLRDTFDEAAELYDRARPRYPDALVRELAARAGLGPGSRVLEIGPGTGQLTVPLARTGCRITAVERGPALAAVARRNLAPFPEARVEVASFEGWPLPEEGFDLVVAATAFHWLDPGAGTPRAAAALRHGGTLALVTTHHVEGGSTGFFADVQRCYERWDPATPEGVRLPPEESVATDTAEITASPLFGAVRGGRWGQETAYTTGEYLDLLRTFSGHRALAPGALEGLLGCVAGLLEGRYGGRVTKRTLHELITAVRTDAAGTRSAEGATGDGGAGGTVGAPAVHAPPGPGGGGDPACLLHRVCPECGRFAEQPDAGRCALCGTPLGAE